MSRNRDSGFLVNRLMLGASGGISASLLPAWVAWLRTTFPSCEIRCVLTPQAEQFVTPRALAVLSGNEVLVDRCTATGIARVEHVEMANWAELVLVAPATMNLIGKLANGIADNLLLTIISSVNCPIILAPALQPTAAARAPTIRNLDMLRADGVGIVPTGAGLSAAGGSPVSAGAMADAPATVAFIQGFLQEKAEGRT